MYSDLPCVLLIAGRSRTRRSSAASAYPGSLSTKGSTSRGSPYSDSQHRSSRRKQVASQGSPAELTAARMGGTPSSKLIFDDLS